MAPSAGAMMVVLKLVATLLGNVDIAENLFLSTTTVNRDVNNIYAKLKVPSCMEAVAKLRILEC